MKLFLFALTFIFTLTLQAFQEDLSFKINQADSLLTEKEYQLSANLWKEILQLSEEVSPQYILSSSKLQFSNGKLLESNGDYSNAAEAYQKALTIIENYNTTTQTHYRVEIYNALYHALAYAGNWQAALERGNEGLTLFDKSIDQETRADYIYDLAYINDQLGNYEQAIALYQKSITLYKGLEENKNFDLGLAF